MKEFIERYEEQGEIHLCQFDREFSIYWKVGTHVIQKNAKRFLDEEQIIGHTVGSDTLFTGLSGHVSHRLRIDFLRWAEKKGAKEIKDLFTICFE